MTPFDFIQFDLHTKRKEERKKRILIKQPHAIFVMQFMYRKAKSKKKRFVVEFKVPFCFHSCKYSHINIISMHFICNTYLDRYTYKNTKYCSRANAQTRKRINFDFDVFIYINYINYMYYRCLLAT